MKQPDYLQGSWRTVRRYDPAAPEDQAIFDDLERRLQGLNIIETPVWLFDAERCQFLWANRTGLEVWQATTLEEARRRDIASSQSEAVYFLLNDYLEQVRRGETPSVWVTLNPKGIVQRYFQSHHLFTLLDQRDCLLIEARAEPPAEELLSLASNHSLILGLYDLCGELISGNPKFNGLAERNNLQDLTTLLPIAVERAHLKAAFAESVDLRGGGQLTTERGERYFSWEIRLLNSRQAEERVLVSFFDQTDRLVAEAEETRGAILEISLEAIIMIDQEGRIIEFNPAAVDLFGYTKSEAIGRQMSDLIVPHRMRHAHKVGLERHQRTNQSHLLGKRIELPSLKADGTEFLAELSIIELKTKDRRHYVGFIRDVENLRRAEARAEAERARFSSVFEHSPDPIMIINSEAEILNANLACVQVFEWSKEELKGEKISSIVRPFKQDEARFEDGVPIPLHEGKSKNGHWVPIEIKRNPFQINKADHEVISLRDLRPQILSDRERVHLTQQMQQSQKMKELGTLAGGVAHYFNNLLAAIIANVEVCRSERALTAELQECLNEIERASTRGGEMVQRILTFSRQTPVGREFIDVSPIANEVLRLVEMAYPPTIQFLLHIPDQLPRVRINGGQLHQSLLNLLTNAAQAIGEKLGRIDLIISQVVITEENRPTHLEAGLYLCLAVKDNGVGMDEETQRLAFDPFFTTKPIGKGTGLGLAEVHGIANENGGGVTLESQRGIGTTISIFLPIPA